MSASSGSRHGTKRATDYLNDLLCQAAEAGADKIELERVPGGVELCPLAGNAGVGSSLKEGDLEAELIESIVRHAGLETRAKGKMTWRIGGENCAILVEKCDSFGESCSRLHLGKPGRRRKSKQPETSFGRTPELGMSP